ncbi:MAG: magnesium/cobalt transporter CorA [Methanobacteriota archaeon]
MHFERHISGKSGLPPGTPIYIGDSPPEETIISAVTYSDKEVLVYDTVHPDDIKLLLIPETNAWIRITGLHDINRIEQTLTYLDVHPLVIEDILNTKGRSKVEEFDEYLFIVLSRFCSRDGDIREEQVSLILTDQIVISCTETQESFSNVQERIRHAKGRFRQNGVDYLAYTIIDTIVDGYFSVLEELEERIEDLEDEIINNPSVQTITSVQIFRHDLVWFRRRIWSLRELITRLERTDSLYIHDSTHVYLRDVYDHSLKIAEDVDVYREMAEGLLEIYLSNISNNTNQIMKMLTIIATIFIPLTFIAGVYGMNFEYMPELTSPYGYPGILIGMAVVGGLMMVYFRNKGWL